MKKFLSITITLAIASMSQFSFANNLTQIKHHDNKALTTMGPQVIHTDKAPAAIGPYVQGVDLGSMVLTSGQIPINPITGEVPVDVEKQAYQSLENVKAIVEGSGLKFSDIVKMTIFVKDMNDFEAINKVYGKFFDTLNSSYPARSFIEVSRLPKDVKIEIEAIAVRSKRT